MAGLMVLPLTAPPMACRNEARGGAARQYAAVYLQVRPQEVEAGMLDHWNCPHNLKAWMTRHGGTGTTAATVLL